MFKKATLALFGMVLAVSLIAPPKASAQIHVGIGIGSPVVVVQPAYVAYDEPYFVSHNWNYGYHDGYYYDHGTRYQRDNRGHRHYDNRYRDGRHARDHGHHGG
jgi:hypothetical protein